MISPKSFGLDNRMTVVLFAGMGGGCDGLEQAGYHVHLAINHDPIAVAVHEKRHPHTKHLRCDVFEVDPRQATRGRGVRVLHASPDCTHFSVAKGGKPVSKRRRSLAWVVVRWAGTVRPETITLENVPEIQTWGPLIAKRDPATGRAMRIDGSVAAKGERIPVQEQWLIPDPKHRGRIWRDWLREMAELGYSFEGRVLVCADYGIATIRKRFFGVAQSDGSAITWPARTHAPRDKAKALGLKPWVGAYTIIDWSLPVKSIFGRKKDLAEQTLRRTARGVMRYVVNAVRPFIVPITHKGDDRVHSVDEPLRAMTTAHRGEFTVVAPSIAKFRTGAVGSDMREPAPTFTADSFETRPGGAIPLGLMGATMQAYYGGEQGMRRGGDPLDPLATFVTEPRHAVVGATMIQSGYGEREGQARRVLDLEDPAGTQVAGGSKAALVGVHLQRQFGESIGADLDEPAPTVTPGGSGKSALVSAFLAQHNSDPRGDGEKAARAGRDMTDPLAAVTTSPQVGVSAVFMAQHNDGPRAGISARDIVDPISALTTSGSQQGVVAASMLNLRGSDKAGRPIAEPTATFTATGNHAGLILAFLQHYYSEGKQGDDLDAPLAALTTKARHGLVTVTVGRETFVITDIGMRMLEPEEGAAAHGFKRGSLPDTITLGGKEVRLTKTQKYNLVGNSVPPEMVRLLAVCNVRAEFAEAAE